MQRRRVDRSSMPDTSAILFSLFMMKLSTIGILAVRILWKFDNDTADFYGNFPRTPINNPLYKTPGIDGYGTCLYLNGSANQSVLVPTPPFLNMAYTSFSLSAWVNANSLKTVCASTPGCCDNAIFGQFNQNSYRRSLHIIVRDRRIYFGFYADDTQGNQTLQDNTWYHVRTSLDPFCRSNWLCCCSSDGLRLRLSKHETIRLCQWHSRCDQCTQRTL